MTTPKPGTRDFYRLEAERLQAQLEKLQDVEGDMPVGLNLQVKRRLRDAARELAQQRGVSMRVVVTEALEQYLDSQQNNG